MHKSIDYYLPLLKYCNDNKLPKDISRYIFNFLKTDIHKELNDQTIYFYVNKHSEYIKKHKDHNYAFTLHINEIPYNIDIYMLKERVSYFLKRINCEKKFSHLCCNLKGVVFEDKKNNLDFIRHKNWFRVI